jgi:hypothetical protein
MGMKQPHPRVPAVDVGFRGDDEFGKTCSGGTVAEHAVSSQHHPAAIAYEKTTLSKGWAPPTGWYGVPAMSLVFNRWRQDAAATGFRI